jgi:hypothetical protein
MTRLVYCLDVLRDWHQVADSCLLTVSHPLPQHQFLPGHVDGVRSVRQKRALYPTLYFLGRLLWPVLITSAKD